MFNYDCISTKKPIVLIGFSFYFTRAGQGVVHRLDYLPLAQKSTSTCTHVLLIILTVATWLNSFQPKTGRGSVFTPF